MDATRQRCPRRLSRPPLCSENVPHPPLLPALGSLHLSRVPTWLPVYVSNSSTQSQCLGCKLYRVSTSGWLDELLRWALKSQTRDEGGVWLGLFFGFKILVYKTQKPPKQVLLILVYIIMQQYPVKSQNQKQINPKSKIQPNSPEIRRKEKITRAERQTEGAGPRTRPCPFPSCTLPAAWPGPRDAASYFAIRHPCFLKTRF